MNRLWYAANSSCQTDVQIAHQHKPKLLTGASDSVSSLNKNTSNQTTKWSAGGISAQTCVNTLLTKAITPFRSAEKYLSS